MKPTKDSKTLMEFFLKNKCIDAVPFTAKSKKIMKKIYSDLFAAHQYVESKKASDGKLERKSPYHVSIRKISTVHEIPRPSQFNADSFPETIRDHIDAHSEYDICYTFSLLQREVRVHFIVEDMDVESQMARYNNHIELIMIWLHFIENYSSNQCAKKMTLFLYLTSLKKVLPESNIDVLDQEHVNTAFTYTCPVVSEIVVFRHEEWFKVLMHELFHNLGLDFSGMNTSECTKKILSIFPVESEVNLYEAYAECWAEILHAAFCSYVSCKGDENVFLEYLYFFVSFERTYSFFQLAKALGFMGLTYKDLYLPSSHIERKTLYKENSNVLAYYVIKTILLNNYNGFLDWCSKNNFLLLQFKKTTGNIEQFCLFIEQNYKKKSMLQGVKCMEDLYHQVEKKSGKKNAFIWNNMRMSISEMG